MNRETCLGVLPYKKRGQVKSALKKLGFTNVCDAAEGAALATEEYVRLLEQGEMKNIITTACPSIVNLIEIHYPELIKYLAPVRMISCGSQADIPSRLHTWTRSLIPYFPIRSPQSTA